MELFFVGLGGIFGAVSRYGISKWVGQRWQGDFPLATFCINISGSFVLGLLYVIFTKAAPEFTYIKNFVTTGFLGAFTTYSTFSFEINNLLKDSKRGIAIIYFLASIIIGLVFAYLGIVVGEYNML